MRQRRPALLAALVTCTLALTACGGGDGGEGSDDQAPDAATTSFASGTTMERLARQGRITVGTKFDQPGFGLQNLEGQPEGFDVEIAQLIAARLGLTPEDISWKETPSAVREEAIIRGEVDIVVATYTINDTRRERVSFAGPYYVAGQQLMVRSDDDRITGPDDLAKNPGVKVCSVTGSTPAETIRDHLADPGQLVLFDVYDKCADALRTRQVDVVTTDNVILLGFVGASDGAFKVVGSPFTEEPYGIGIRKGDVAFCEFINESLREVAGSGDYTRAWESTAGTVAGARTPTLPEPDDCR